MTMQRFSLDGIIQQAFYDQVMLSDNTDLPPEERPDRADRSDLGVLKDGDDVTMTGGLVVRVLCPGRGKAQFNGWFVDTALYNQPTPYSGEVYEIADRAPVDPNEEAMPAGFPPERPSP